MKRFPFTAVLLAAITIPIICFLWQDNLLIAVLLSVITAVTLWVRKRMDDVIRFIVAAVFGSSLEAICIYFGAWSYSNPTFLIPFWLPIAWGLAGIILGSLVEYFREGLNIKEGVSGTLPVHSLIVFAALAGVISLFWQENVIVTGLLSLVSIVMLVAWKTGIDTVRFIVSFLVGPSMEIICIYFGVWVYTNPFVMIPLWLPLVWGLMGLSLGRLSEYFISKTGGLLDTQRMSLDKLGGRHDS